jgi:hypothetical protein
MPASPKRRKPLMMFLLAGLEEEGLILAGGADLAADVVGEVGAEDGMGELLEEDGREDQIEVQCNAVALEVGEHAQQGKIRLGGCFVEPFDAMRPSAVVDDEGQMSVQREGQKTCRAVLPVRRSQS